MRNIEYYIIAFLSVITFLRCKDMNSTYLEYLEGGEIIYVSKADSLVARSGLNSVTLSWIPGVDNKAVYAKIYWNNREDSMEYNIPPNLDRINVSIALPEGAYSFEVFTFDALGNKSIAATAEGSSYGDYYMSTLTDRVIERSSYRVIHWGEPYNNMAGVEVVYKDFDGKLKKLFVKNTESYTIIPDYKYYSEIQYRTFYFPDENSVDTFFTDFKTVTLDSIVDSSWFLRWNNEFFPYKQFGTYPIERMWDGNTNADFGYVWEDAVLPASITFDIGQLAILKKMRLFSHYNPSFLYKYGHLKHFQVWGSQNPNASSAFEDWIFLGEFNSHRPSGLADNIAPTPEDLAYASQGEYFNLNQTNTEIRYIRIVVLSVYSGSTAYFPRINITELTFWGDVR
ncbi:DUF4998 domain-containing protein [Petrimonas mucosa]|uniref:DUF5000 domain-containing protein n=1 Tax=Petrimonas mucosa TaxID=1642646 RepID=A0A1G4G6B0_9BACT|nr:DUF4998 domain-containing protein [Petrimonas mucosa]SCM57252.1 putative protein {ECO:0000313/EMBL:ACU04500,1} [Petrimonas mucosa]